MLKELGITRGVIQESMGKQSRSSITGTYHIVLHHIQKQTLGIHYEEYANMAGDATESAPSAQNTMHCAPSIAKSLFGRGRVSPLDGSHKNGGNGAKINFGVGNKVSRDFVSFCDLELDSFSVILMHKIAERTTTSWSLLVS